MSGIKMLSALEIFTNPYDLDIWVAKSENEDGGFGFAITRGPEHRHKPIVSSAFFGKTRQEAIDEVVENLEAIRVAVRKELDDSKSTPSSILNPDGANIDESKVLSEALIARIKSQLEEGHSAATYLYEKPAASAT